MGMRIDRYQDLDVYKAAFTLQQSIYGITKAFPREEAYSLSDQIRRSSRSIGANIAEAWQKRRYPAHFASKLSDSDSEQSETQHWIATALSCGYIDPVIGDDLMRQCQAIGAMLGNMIMHSEDWCLPKKSRPES